MVKLAYCARSSKDRVGLCGRSDDRSIRSGRTHSTRPARSGQASWRSAGNGNRTLSKSVASLRRVSSSLTSSAGSVFALDILGFIRILFK